VRVRRAILGPLIALVPAVGAAAPVIVDYQAQLGPRFVKRPRKETRFIIVHSTECRLESALRTLSRGKVRRGRYITRGGHANYLVARSGRIYRLLDPRYRADHAGVSMWNGVENLSDVSLGVELEGFHDEPFSAAQYRSLRWLLGVLRRRYHIRSEDVLEHYRVAYTRPNRFYSRPWRGRKRDPGLGNFDRSRAGLEHQYVLDPDVVAGRLGGPRSLAGGTRALLASHTVPAPAHRIRAGVVTGTSSAWSIAGPDYAAASTLYVFPDGSSRSGDLIRDWAELPSGTEVYTGVPHDPSGVVSRDRTAWTIAGGDYDEPTTLYTFPDGHALRGDEVRDWSSLPAGTRVQLDVPDQPER
jgi:N-acetylmuramoyl-L-alanine amidase